MRRSLRNYHRYALILSERRSGLARIVQIRPFKTVGGANVDPSRTLSAPRVVVSNIQYRVALVHLLRRVRHRGSSRLGKPVGRRKATLTSSSSTNVILARNGFLLGEAAAKVRDLVHRRKRG